MRQITAADIEEVLQITVSDEFAEKIDKAKLTYALVNGEERAQCFAHIKKIIGNPQAVQPGDSGALLRFKQEFIKPTGGDFEKRFLGFIKEWLLGKYFAGLDVMRELDRKSVLNCVVPDAAGKRAGVYTMGAIGGSGREIFIPFLEQIIARRPAICMHIEPIAEFLDEKNELDKLCLDYGKALSGVMLSGLLSHLRALEEKGTIKIIRAQRTFFGTFLSEPYSVVVWVPEST